MGKLNALLELVIGRCFIRIVVFEADDSGALPLAYEESEWG
jgi:hypothetical protein